MSRTMYWVTRDGSRRWVMLCEGTADEYHADTRNPLRIPACQAHVIVMTELDATFHVAAGGQGQNPKGEGGE